jgi:hypothetical protein
MHEVDGPSTVDELVTELPDGTRRDELAGAVERHAGATLLSSQADRGADSVSETLRLACAVVEGGDDVLNRAISVTCVCSKSWVSGGDAARAVPTGRLALDRRDRSCRAPAGRRSRRRTRCRFACKPRGAASRRRPVAFVARPLSLRFTADEVARVEALVRLRDRASACAAEESPLALWRGFLRARRGCLTCR